MALPSTLSASERAAISEFVVSVSTLPGLEIKEARLFGSRARGEGHAHSDIDIALIVGDGGRARRHAVYDLAFDVGLAHGVEIAPLVLEVSQWQMLRERERQIARDIELEGIRL